VAHCPTVFSRRGILLEGFSRYRAAGVNLGTDTFPRNFAEELRTAAILARVAAGQAHAVTAADIFTAATIGGARALGRDDLGRIGPGAKADFVMVDFTHPAMQPLYDPVRSLVYATGERAIRHVFVGGQQVVRDGKALTFDYADASARLEWRSAAQSKRCRASIGPGAAPPRSLRRPSRPGELPPDPGSSLRMRRPGNPAVIAQLWTEAIVSTGDPFNL
jgi:5-methylthioadenosine/S-adenosylhomocysteine deaminase